MLYLVAYDISASKRLRKVARICEDYGLRIEKSVFECRLDQNSFAEFWDKVSRCAIEDEGDRIIAYPVALLEERKIKRLGQGPCGERDDILIF